jgi:maltose O-acetyltransferase
MTDTEKEIRNQLFYELFGEAGASLWIEPPFYCDYGYNIKLGENVFSILIVVYLMLWRLQ